MDYSISTHCLISKPLKDALDELEKHTKFVEVMSDGLHLLSDAKLLSEYDFKYSIHAPSRGVNIASVLEPIRRATVDVVKAMFPIASEFNAPVVIHPGYFAWENEQETAKNALKKSLAEISASANDYGVRFFIENMGNWGYFFLKTKEDIPLLNGAEFCLDVGHANEVGVLDEFLKVKFSHIHLHDNNGKKDSHWAVGEGNISFAQVMKKIKENRVEHPVIEVESLEGALLSLERLRGFE
ncbi:MAG: sugar phosphate isomerase/epimerase family protein [Methanocorpusculum sp.]|nr:sugar phosphate isomerase/epimerase family protein [Methanocorpusculum sp.]